MGQWRVAGIAALPRFIMCGVRKVAGWRLYLYKCVRACVSQTVPYIELVAMLDCTLDDL